MPDGSVASALAAEKPKHFRSRQTIVDQPAVLPSVETLARHMRQMAAAEDAVLDAYKAETGRFTSTCNLFDTRSDALTKFALTIPARSMADAVAQTGLAMVELDLVLEGAENSELSLEQRTTLTGVARALASIFPVIASASGVDPLDLVQEWCIKDWHRKFGLEERFVPTGGAA